MSFNTPESIAIELETYVMNELRLYRRFTAIADCLVKKHKKGNYDPEKALVIWESWVFEGAKLYMKEFKMPQNIRYVFPKDIRKIVAQSVEEYAFDEYIKNS